MDLGGYRFSAIASFPATSFTPRETVQREWAFPQASQPIWRPQPDRESEIFSTKPIDVGLYLNHEHNNDGVGALVETHLDHTYKKSIAITFENDLSAIELRLVNIAQGCKKWQQMSLQCYDHGCNGRAFSCLENFRRHIREQSGSGRVACAFCLKLFTRKSNRSKHIREGKCKALRGKRNSGPDLEIKYNGQRSMRTITRLCGRSAIELPYKS